MARTAAAVTAADDVDAVVKSLRSITNKLSAARRNVSDLEQQRDETAKRLVCEFGMRQAEVARVAGVTRAIVNWAVNGKPDRTKPTAD